METRKRIMILGLVVSVFLMAIKFYAYYITHSNAILTDAAESIVNVIAGAFALFSLFYASKPADEDHPYGHGKIEFFSSGFEGGMITIAGIGMVFKGSIAFFQKQELHDVDIGIYLSLFAALVNYFVGTAMIRKGKSGHSDLMIASGKHLVSDTVSSIGLVIGLVLVYFTKIDWIDYVIAILFGVYITLSGFRILRESVLNLLDKTDYEKIDHIIEILNKNRRKEWIDIHNLRVLKYGAVLHIDCHVTLPWYNNLEESHSEVDAIEKLAKAGSTHDLEFFIHADPCLPISCSICQIDTCQYRKSPFKEKLEWNMKNVLPDQKHQAS